jgi:hypothetical protein
MTSQIALAGEPLTLFTVADVSALYDRAALHADLAATRLPRQRVDRRIAKVLPAGSVLRVDDVTRDVVRVVDCAYRPFFEKELFALNCGLEPAPFGSTWERPAIPPSERILERLLAFEGVRYLFGGSAPEGSDRQMRWLVESERLLPDDLAQPDLRRLARSAGIDCSGLFNAATEYAFFGDTKDVYSRFARSLVRLPGAVDARMLADALEPLDIVLFRGHMLLALGGGRVIQAVGDGVNATTFAAETGHGGPPFTKYDRVVIDSAEPIFNALLQRQGRRFSADWRMDDAHFMIVRFAR